MPLGCCGDEDCEVIAVGIPGPPGKPGKPGDSGQVSEYYHTQTTPSSSWLVPHNLGKEIVGALVYSPDMTVQYDAVFVEQLDPNTCRLWMTPPVPGVARIF
jgi:hypothetical protein